MGVSHVDDLVLVYHSGCLLVWPDLKCDILRVVCRLIGRTSHRRCISLIFPLPLGTHDWSLIRSSRLSCDSATLEASVNLGRTSSNLWTLLGHQVLLSDYTTTDILNMHRRLQPTVIHLNLRRCPCLNGLATFMTINVSILVATIGTNLGWR